MYFFNVYFNVSSDKAREMSSFAGSIGMSDKPLVLCCKELIFAVGISEAVNVILLEVIVCSCGKNYAYHELGSFDAARCIVKCCSVKLNSCSLADMESLDL